MINESMAEDSGSESSSNEVASDRETDAEFMPRVAAASRKIRSMPRKVMNAGKATLTSGLTNRNNKRREELFFHLMSFWIAASDETFKYLKVLSFSGRAAADKKAAEEGWLIDYIVVEEYRAGMRAIAAKYEDTILTKSLTQSVRMLFEAKEWFKRLMRQSHRGYYLYYQTAVSGVDLKKREVKNRNTDD